jgi:hypothetical protein
MIRFTKALLTVLACILVACANPRVVTVVVPYVPVLNLQPFSIWNGAADCDLNGQPVIYLHPSLSSDVRPWIYTHELIHTEQMKAWGGCARFSARVRADSMFRLHVEAEAYCGIWRAQRMAHLVPYPSYESIVDQLADDYGHKFERDTVRAALPCR